MRRHFQSLFLKTCHLKTRLAVGSLVTLIATASGCASQSQFAPHRAFKQAVAPGYSNYGTPSGYGQQQNYLPPASPQLPATFNAAPNQFPNPFPPGGASPAGYGTYAPSYGQPSPYVTGGQPPKSPMPLMGGSWNQGMTSGRC